MTLKCAKMSADKLVEANILGSFKEQLISPRTLGIIQQRPLVQV